MTRHEYIEFLKTLPIDEVKRLNEMDKEDRDNTQSITRKQELTDRISVQNFYLNSLNTI